MSSPAPRARTGCQNCRLRHLKCDDRKPACSRCEKASIECVRGYNIRFKHGANPSVANLKGSGLAKTEYDWSDQPWVRTDRNLTFLDETPELNSLYEGDSFDSVSYGDPRSQEFLEKTTLPPSTCLQATVNNIPQLLSSTPTGSLHTDSPDSGAHFRGATERFGELTSPEKRRRLTVSGSRPYDGSLHDSPASASANSQQVVNPSQSFWGTGSHSMWTPSTLENSLDIGPQNAAVDPSFAGLERTGSHGISTAFTAVSDSLTRIYLDAPAWPLKDREEARLLRYFVENLARSFDLTDRLQHFRRVVPQRAATCPPLLNAIFALSARHLSHTHDYDHLISNRYIQECLKHLIPMLDDNSALLDENLLASTIILRHVEEFEVPVSGQTPGEQESHLFGAHAFITAQERATSAGGLRQAAFWVGLRQEIYVAFVNQRSIIPALEHCNIDRSFDPATDDIWACRMVVLSADIIRYCFGDHDHPQSTYTFLSDCTAQWYNSKPPSFTPVYERSTGDDIVFPEFQFIADDVVTGLQHYYLSKILLVAHNPKIPRLGPIRAAALKAADDEVMECVRILCGICSSNPDTPPNYIYAAMAIVIAGDKFTDRREQNAVLEILHTCEKTHAWMTETVQANLKTAWGWSET